DRTCCGDRATAAGHALHRPGHARCSSRRRHVTLAGPNISARPMSRQTATPTSDDLADTVWVFGYGSLIYKVDFDVVEQRTASIRGWARRFWQGSHDHRGTPDAPGRVVTLVPEPDAVCVGMAYRIAPHVFAHLDHREKNGYVRLRT